MASINPYPCITQSQAIHDPALRFLGVATWMELLEHNQQWPIEYRSQTITHIVQNPLKAECALFSNCVSGPASPDPLDLQSAWKKFKDWD